MLFLRGFPAVLQVEMPVGARKRQRASPSPAGPQAFEPDASPKGGRGYGKKEVLGKSLYFHHEDESIRCFPTLEQPAEPHSFKVQEVKQTQAPRPRCVCTHGRAASRDTAISHPANSSHVAITL